MLKIVMGSRFCIGHRMEIWYLYPYSAPICRVDYVSVSVKKLKLQSVYKRIKKYYKMVSSIDKMNLLQFIIFSPLYTTNNFPLLTNCCLSLLILLVTLG